MTVLRSRRLGFYLVLGGLCLLAGLALARPEPVALAAPLLLAASVGLVTARRPELRVRTSLDRGRALEGEEVEVRLEVTAARPVARLEPALVPPPGIEVAAVPSLPRSRLAAGESRTFVWRLACRRWGGRLVGEITVHARDPLGFYVYRMERRERLPLRVYPRPEALRALLRPADTQAMAGNQVSRARGEGIEFADIRPFAPGDRVRRINWRVSARRAGLHVNESHPERNSDLVLFLDTFVELRSAAGSSIDMAVRAALALTRAGLAQRDRVGLIGFGGTLRWLRPEMGERQLYRIMDALIDTEVVLSYAWKGLEVLPPRTLPPRSMVVALTPLLDERSVAALLDLRARGHDLAVLEISAARFVTPGRRQAERIAYRIWEMERETLRARFGEMGVAVAGWEPNEPLLAPLALLAAVRQRTPLVVRPL
jgi:uncharacterized protein (DUF58 family)